MRSEKADDQTVSQKNLTTTIKHCKYDAPFVGCLGDKTCKHPTDILMFFLLPPPPFVTFWKLLSFDLRKTTFGIIHRH